MGYFNDHISFKVAKSLERRGYYKDIEAVSKVFYDRNGNIIAEPTPWPVTSWRRVELWLQEKYEIYVLVARRFSAGPFFCAIYRPAVPSGKHPEGRQPMKRVGRTEIADTYEQGMVITLERAIKAVPVRPPRIINDDDLPF